MGDWGGRDRMGDWIFFEVLIPAGGVFYGRLG